jgi:hypothetical protein
MKLEVENKKDIEGYVLNEKTYWVASVMEIKGKEEHTYIDLERGLKS